MRLGKLAIATRRPFQPATSPRTGYGARLSSLIAIGLEEGGPVQLYRILTCMASHERIERFSYALHVRIAELIEADPSLLNHVTRNIELIREKRGDSVLLREWEAIVRAGVAAVVRALRDAGQRATELRSASPFTGVITAAERDKIFRSEITAECRSEE